MTNPVTASDLAKWMRTPTQTEAITAAFEHDINEAAHWFGGWKELRKVIDALEELSNEAAWERATGAND